MAEKFDKYYEYFTGKARAGLKPRSIRLGIISIELGGESTGLRITAIGRRHGKVVVKGVVAEGGQVDLKGPLAGVKVVRGGYVRVRDAELELVEGDYVTLINVNVKRVNCRHAVIINCNIGHVECEEVKMINTDVDEAVIGHGEFVNCSIGSLTYREFYRAVNTEIKNVSKKSE